MGVNGTAKKFKVKKIVKHAVREYITIVDAEDAHLLRSYSWTIVANDDSQHYYVVRHGTNGHEYLHQIVAGAPQGEPVIHINGDSLDNRKANLLRQSDRIEEVE